MMEESRSGAHLILAMTKVWVGDFSAVCGMAAAAADANGGKVS